jgi:hypothetical protein
MRILKGKIRFLLVAAVLAIMFACAHKAFGSRYTYKATAMPEPVQMSNRLQRLFSKTKVLCFGRYALEVPMDAQLIFGGVSDINIFNDRPDGLKVIADAELARVKRDSLTSEITYNGEGPIPDSWQIRYFEDKWSKSDGALMYETYVRKGNHIFSTRDLVQHGKKDEIQVALRQRSFAKLLRLRADDEAPREPGFCIPHAFLAESTYAEQEMSNAGLFLPSLPDVSFSVHSNKDAYADYDKTEFETVWRSKLSLIGRLNEAKKDQPFTYPSHTLLRQGKRDVHHWHGEESLIKRKDGSHDFEWALVGTPLDVANPSEFNAVMYSKVEHNKVGAAREASLSDDEAVALFDRLLAGFKFRVQVPGAPAGSYYFPVDPAAPSTSNRAP